MSKLLLCSTVAALAVALPSVALACEGHAEHAEASFKKVTVTEVVNLQKAKKATLLDANGSETRAKYGTIPGAVLLSSHDKYDAAKELPASKDAKLVFYCANTRCTASHAAAERAISLGYKDVSILPDGIMGWKAAGQPTATPRS